MRDADIAAFRMATRIRRNYRVGASALRSEDGHPAYHVAKRVFDIVMVSVGLVVLAPLMALIALAILLDGTGGPILYRQPRVGRHGRRFTMLKFRTMRLDRRVRQMLIPFPDRRRSLKSENDPRVTRIGRILRRTSLDELPQLLNILRGEMSLVGPRPEQPEMLHYYGPEHYQRHVAMPGLTGWWQINGRCFRGSQIEPREDLHQKLVDDLYYLEHRSFWFDLRVCLQTIPIFLAGRGAI